MANLTPITVAHGDGIGPEIMEATIAIGEKVCWGKKVYPDGFADRLTSDSWICRFTGETEGAVVSHAQIISLLQRTKDAGFDFIKFESFCNFDGKAGFSLGQGQ